MLGIAIPTLNRPDFLIRQLTYYAEMGFRHTIYIGDSSGPGYAEQVAEMVGRLQNHINIVLLLLPGLNSVEATTELLHAVKEPYAVLMGDDDFLVPASLEMGERFLDTHPDFNTAHGVAALCFVELDDSQRHVVTGLGEYAQRSLEHASAEERLVDYLGNYFVTHFSLHRTKNFSREMNATREITDGAFGELVSGCLSVIGGKAKQFDCFGLVRQTHQRRYRAPDIFDWITKEDWLPSYRVFRDCLAEEVARQDGISMEEASVVVKKAFWAYLARSLSRKWQGRYEGRDSGVRGRARRVGRAVPGARRALRTWREVRAMTRTGREELSLAALLRPSSQYHADFMPIYRAITTSEFDLPTTVTGSI